MCVDHFDLSLKNINFRILWANPTTVHSRYKHESDRFPLIEILFDTNELQYLGMCRVYRSNKLSHLLSRRFPEWDNFHNTFLGNKKIKSKDSFFFSILSTVK